MSLLFFIYFFSVIPSTQALHFLVPQLVAEGGVSVCTIFTHVLSNVFLNCTCSSFRISCVQGFLQSFGIRRGSVVDGSSFRIRCVQGLVQYCQMQMYAEGVLLAVFSDADVRRRQLLAVSSISIAMAVRRLQSRCGKW